MTRVERQVCTLMRAWPIPDRIERGNEIASTTLDLVPSGRSRLPLALAINLVVGGFSARWRMRPPPWRWVWYRLGGRLPTQWHQWMLNDLSSRGYQRRFVAFRVTLFLPVTAVAWAVPWLTLPHPEGPRPSSIFHSVARHWLDCGRPDLQPLGSSPGAEEAVGSARIPPSSTVIPVRTPALTAAIQRPSRIWFSSPVDELETEPARKRPVGSRPAVPSKCCAGQKTTTRLEF